MGWRFRKSFKIFPGVRWNIGKRGSSVSVGGKGMTVNYGKHGTRTTIGVPGTGLSYSTQRKHQKTQRIQPPPLPTPGQSMAKKNNGKWFYIGGAALIGIAILGKMGSSSSSELPAKSTYSPPLTPPIPDHLTAPISAATPIPQPIRNDLAAAASKPATQATAPVATPPPPVVPVIKEPNPPSDNYVPKEVVVTTAVAFPVKSGGVQTGLASIPAGTKVKLIKITGYNVLIEHKGSQKSISAGSTDLIEQMLGTRD